MVLHGEVPSLRLLLSCGLLVVAIGLTIVNTRLHRKDPAVPFAAALGLALVLWTPPWLQTVCLAGFLAAALIAIGQPLGALVAGGAVAAAAWWTPGGGGALALAGFVISVPFTVRAAFARLRRIRAARTLVPGERPRGDVQLHGRVRVRAPAPPPPERPALRAAVWELKCPDHAIASGALVEIVTPQGLALLDPAGATLELGERTESLSTDVARVMLLALEVPPDKLGKDLAGALRWIEDGAEVYVVGIPTWEAAASLADGYRDAPTVPVFRARPDASVLLVDRPEVAVRGDAVGRIWGGYVWGPVCAALAALQVWRAW